MTNLLLLDKSLSVFDIDVDIELSELSRLEFVGKQDIQFFVGASLALGKSEKGPDEEDERRSRPEEPSLSFPIQCSGVQEVRVDGAASDVGDIVSDSSKTYTLVSETGCGCLANNGIADWSDSEVVDEEPQKHHNGLCIVGSHTVRVCGADGTGCGEDDGE